MYVYSLDYISKKHRGMEAYTGTKTSSEFKEFINSGEVLSILKVYRWIKFNNASNKTRIL